MHVEINKILLTDWDPIGIGDSCPPDEYLDYAKKIQSLIEVGCKEEGIFYYLREIRLNFMKLERHDSHDNRVAKVIYEKFSC